MAEPLIKAQFEGNLDYGHYYYYLNLNDEDLFNNAREHLFPEALNYQKEIMAIVNDRAIWVNEARLQHWLSYLETDPNVKVQYAQINHFHERVQAQLKVLKQKYALQHIYRNQLLERSLAAGYLIWTTPVIWWLLNGLVKWKSLNIMSFTNCMLLLLILITFAVDAIIAIAWAWPIVFNGLWQSFKDLYWVIYDTTWLQKWRKRLAAPSYYLDGQQIKRMGGDEIHVE